MNCNISPGEVVSLLLEQKTTVFPRLPVLEKPSNSILKGEDPSSEGIEKHYRRDWTVLDLSARQFLLNFI